MPNPNGNSKSLESWIWDAARSIRGANLDAVEAEACEADAALHSILQQLGV